MSVNPYRNAKCPSKTKISQLDNSILVNEQILGLQVSVEDSSLVAKQNARKDLVQVALQMKKKSIKFPTDHRAPWSHEILMLGYKSTKQCCNITKLG